jgi:hypothetical protein
MEIKKSNKRIYEFVKKNKPNYFNPDDTIFNSDKFEEWEEEYRDEEIKPVPEEIEEIDFS